MYGPVLEGLECSGEEQTERLRGTTNWSTTQYRHTHNETKLEKSRGSSKLWWIDRINKMVLLNSLDK